MSKNQNFPTALPSQPARERLNRVAIFHREDPESLFNKLPPAYRKYLLAVEEDEEALRCLKWGERMIRKEFKPTAEQARLRLSFWDEYARSLDTGALMRMEYIPAGAMSDEGFVSFIQDPRNMAYLCNVPPHYHRAAEEILLMGLERLRDIFEIPFVNDRGQVNGAVISGVIKAVDMLDKRVKGAILQKVAVHQHHTSEMRQQAPGEKLVQAPSPEALAFEEIRHLEEQIAQVRERMQKNYALMHAKVGTGEVEVVVEKAELSEE